MDKLHKQQVAKRQRFAIKKLTVGTASVLVGLTFIISGNAKADTTVAAQNTFTTQVTDPQVSAHSSNIRISDESNTVVHQTSSTLVPNKTTTPAQQMPIIHKTQQNNHCPVSTTNTAKQPLPSKYNITMNFRDVTLHKPIQVISNGHYVFKQLNIHIPDGYQLVPGESVPTFYTFKDGNPNQIISCWLIPTNGGQPTTNDHQGQGTPATNTPTNTTPNGNAVTGKLEGNVPNMQTGKTITFQPTTAKDNQLPQTGNDNSLTLMGLGASTLLGMFGLAAVNKKRK